MNLHPSWQTGQPSLPTELAAACLTRPSIAPELAAEERRAETTCPTSDLLLLVPDEETAGVETGAQLEQLRTELTELGISPIVWNGGTDPMTEGPTSPAPFRRALALRGFSWGQRSDHLWRSKRGIVLGGGASLREKLAVKAGIEAVVGAHGLIAFYVADDAAGDSSFVGADGDLALFRAIAGLRGTGSDHALNRLSSASIQIEQSCGILETPALAEAVAVATARVLHVLIPAGAA